MLIWAVSKPTGISHMLLFKGLSELACVLASCIQILMSEHTNEVSGRGGGSREPIFSSSGLLRAYLGISQSEWNPLKGAPKHKWYPLFSANPHLGF